MDNFKFTFKYEYDGKEIIMTLPGDSDIDTMMDSFKSFLLASSWPSSVIESYFSHDE